jgi:cell division transport system permease protein
MSGKHFKKYTYDISLDEGVGARLVSWVTGLMVFFVTLTLALNFGLSSVAKTWVTGLSGTLTVEIKPPLSPADGEKISAQSQRKFEDSIRNVLAMLKNNASVRAARQLSEPEIKNLIEPWLGQGTGQDTGQGSAADAALDAIPLPALIDIKLAPDADVQKIRTSLKIIEPDATVDSQSDALSNVKTLVNTATLFMLLLTGVITGLAVVTISGIVRSKLLIHQSEVETLHLIGASDEYIARQFRQHTLRGTLRGALAGLGCLLLTMFVIGAATHTIESSFLPHLKLMPLQWAVLLIVPLVSGALIAHLTAQATVLKELSRLP